MIPSSESLQVQKHLPTYRTGRRYFEYQKNTQTSHITFTPDYYQSNYAPSLVLQRRYYQTLSEQPPRREAPEVDFRSQPLKFQPVTNPPPVQDSENNKFQGAPTLDERLNFALEEKRRADEILEKERAHQMRHIQREQETAMRAYELRELEADMQSERSKQLSRSMQYRSALDLQSQLRSELSKQEGFRAGDSSLEQNPYLPIIRSTMNLPKNKNHLAVDLAPLPEFQQTRYTARHPKRIPTNPITFMNSPPKSQVPEEMRTDAAKFFGIDEEDKRAQEPRRGLARNMSDYANMVIRPLERSPFSEPVYGKRAGLNYSDTRHLIL